MEYIPDVLSMTYSAPVQIGLAEVMKDQTNPAMVEGAQ
jgi:hypothetical protein